ncbi:hypothetical protein [Novipirellula artificiosorum]|uniref:Secreted protein n=1 Tax=Novipirellula artificiosorum TaxID=2528016 RepID=A0A5C6DBT6_9BACT|nr:hypothetical protein [Novipirellula artificiosorum]TWU33314.1 hypothetical protein Poly41_50670 [Novipirellula artificiosorum]
MGQFLAFPIRFATLVLLATTMDLGFAAAQVSTWQPTRDGSPWPQPVQFEAPLTDPPLEARSPHSFSRTRSGGQATSAEMQSQNVAGAIDEKGQPVGLLADLFPPIMPAGDPIPSHRVIRSPNQRVIEKHLGSRYTETHPPHTSHRQRMTYPPATIPQAKESPTWKAPYSYGYFGAKTTPRWSQHHGYRDNYTQWTRQ